MAASPASSTSRRRACAFAAAPSPFPTRAQGLILAPLTVNANTKHKECSLRLREVGACARRTRPSLQDILGASERRHRGARGRRKTSAKKPWLKVFDEQTPNAVPQLVAGFEARTPEIQQIIIEQVLKVLQGGMDPQKAMDEAQSLAAAKLKK